LAENGAPRQISQLLTFPASSAAISFGLNVVFILAVEL